MGVIIGAILIIIGVDMKESYGHKRPKDAACPTFMEWVSYGFVIAGFVFLMIGLAKAL